MKWSFKPNRRKRLRTHGFRQRIREAARVLSTRRLKGRKQLTVSNENKKY